MAERSEPRRGMGRGLAAILPQRSATRAGAARDRRRADPPEPAAAAQASSTPRRSIALAESIKARGVLQPIVVRPLPGGSTS